MKGIKIENKDMVLAGGRSVIIQDLEYYSQRIRHSIRLFLGESVYEPLSGVDWRTVFSTKVSRDRILTEIKKTIQKDPETVSVEKVELVERESSSRRIYIQFSAITKYGIVTGEL
ncbi:hypothetical protein [Leptospira kirschneri]|uniref:PF10934 family protein n=1 Tax=Leptospira kirschneri str. 200802841 TaxID=1193047 RepID=A0A828YAJ2_9LEPT|nr:hypothetical protein [Leptospira kirschneri]EMO74876.1 hypothetical protein LEP1GSC127_3268 [Leptospira kirschneri str. 200801925]EJO71416.1 hypothetical protein LEP1GSC044_1434 [Leptospira kirschneri serovar Grippotyphosa str. RM52]EKO52872.1 hypothetical protein LEP1GSC131_3332 [Leptospira kirschneri str. 200802841]EKQ82181.1 hypothetical protein LEP1GSC064_3891 [Leptospira kirschneri serovar Grippotyphosa str. Moskva]EKR10197.1 hypothetical protein LEP1GSC122_4066 [Leptospira kirschneri 